MNQKASTRAILFAPTCRALALTCCLVALSGCQSDFFSAKWLAFKNPFKASAPAATPSDIPKPGDVPRLGELAKPSFPAKPGEPARDKQQAQVLRPDAKAAEFAQEMTRAKNLERSGNYGEARAAYERLIARYPDRYEPFHRLGVVFDREKRFAEAQAVYLQAIRLNPGHPDLHNDLGYCLFLQGQLDRAEAAVAHAIQLAPDNPRYHNNLGMILGHQRRYDEALDQFRRGGNEADAYYNLAFILAARHDTEGAKRCFRMALRVNPSYDPARRALDSLERATEERRGPADSPAAEDIARGQRRPEIPRAAERPETQPISPASAVESAVGRQQQDPVLLR